MTRTLSVALFLSGLFFGLRAQEPAPAEATPPVPRLAAAPDMTAWTIQYQYKVADPYPKTSNPIDNMVYDKMRKEHPRLMSVVTEKAGNRRKEVQHFADGSETVNWVVGDYMVGNYRVTHTISTVNSRQAEIPFKQDFYQLGWINKAQFQGRQSYQGVSCWAYHRPPGPDNDEQTAYIDAKSGLPVAIEKEDAIVVYSFAASGDALDVPPEINREIQKLQQSLAPHNY